ncbi:MAG: glycyl-radical enzyme activating protein [Cyclobacteriaceae bacterium]|nr:glycyl-radical enzyme activating protein [Cyclobacteriaceae bacterium]
MIFNIQRYSIHDGKGVRTSIFLKGCPLRCPWCSNPESQSFAKEILFDESRCMEFGDCTSVEDGVFSFSEGRLLMNRKVLADAGHYEETCPSMAISVAGYEKTVEQVLNEIEKDEQFYRLSEGGITLTGGEPFAQDNWILDLVLALKKRGIPVAAETCLHISRKKLSRFIHDISEFLIDLKHVDAEKFRSFTGGNLELVLGNLKFLDHHAVPYRLRIPVIPGFNHSFADMKRIINFSANLKNCRHMDFIPYHNLGESKYRMLGRTYSYAGSRPVDEQELEKYLQYATEKGFTVTTGG